MRAERGSRFPVPGSWFVFRVPFELSAGLAAIAVLVFGQNLFGRELNALFLRLPGIDKALHVLEYLLVYVAVHALAGRVWPDRAMRSRVAVAAGLLLAATDETVQGFVPGRSVESFDMVANLAGLTIGWVAVHPRRTRLTWAAAALALCAGAYVTWHTHVLLIDYSRGLRYSQQQDFVRAREHFRLALDAGLRTPGLFNELGWVEIESGVGDPVKAVEYARTALDMQPGNPDVLDTYGWALHHAGRNGEAVTALRRAYELDPDIFCIHYHLGAAYLAAGRRDEAERHFRRQVERRDTREAAFALQALAGLEARR